MNLYEYKKEDFLVWLEKRMKKYGKDKNERLTTYMY